MTTNNTVPDSYEHMYEVPPSEFDDSDEDIIYEDYEHIRSFLKSSQEFCLNFMSVVKMIL